MKAKTKNNRVQTTIVELLCAIAILFVIIFVGIYGINELSSTSLKSSVNEKENIIISAAQNYLFNNPSEVPTVIGKSTKVSLNQLKESGFLKNNILNDDKASCMDNSYVRVYKKSNNNYQYTPYIYCDNQGGIEDNTSSDGIVNAFFVNVKKVGNDYDITNTSITIELSGGTTPQNTPLELESYSYSISLLKDNGKWEKLYQSNKLEVNDTVPVIIQEQLADYLELKYVNDILVHIEQQNTAGRIKAKDYSLRNSL